MLKFKILFILSFVLFSSSLIGQNKLTLRFLSLLGISKDINSSVRSTIGLYIGARYEILDRLFFQSTGDQIEFFSTQSDHEEKLSYEIEVSYNYRISQTVGVNTSFYYSANFLIFAGTLGASVYF